MNLREDSDPYCLLWVGLLVLASYYFNFLYLTIFDPQSLSSFIIFSLPLLGIPFILVFTFIGYLRPERGRRKPNMLAISVVFSLFYFLFSMMAYDLLYNWNFNTFMEAVGFCSWGIGAAVLTAGGFSIMQPLDDSVNRGLLDLKALHYPPGEIVEETPKTEELKEESDSETKEKEEPSPAE